MYPNIEAERARIGWSKTDLAKGLGVSRGTVKNWMNGKTEIPVSKLIKMTELFNCTTDYLLGVDSQKPRQR